MFGSRAQARILNNSMGMPSHKNRVDMFRLITIKTNIVQLKINRNTNRILLNGCGYLKFFGFTAHRTAQRIQPTRESGEFGCTFRFPQLVCDLYCQF